VSITANDKPHKSEVVISLELWQIASKFQRQIRHFRWWRARLKCSQLISTTNHNEPLPEIETAGQKGLYYHVRLSVVVAIARCQFIRAGRGRKLHTCSWNCHPTSHGSRDISISGFNGRNTISGWRTLSYSLGDTLFGLAVVKNTWLVVGISELCVVVPAV